jgi:hypothetical protein
LDAFYTGPVQLCLTSVDEREMMPAMSDLRVPVQNAPANRIPTNAKAAPVCSLLGTQLGTQTLSVALIVEIMGPMPS